ncbi:zinc finger protein 551-like [Armigeres subalbatus]|uniref:zinc finger protein 551-like n=1 Tax=Armigeres subalbatus TaxID=124917 RepID=UPI002ED651D9
MTIFKLQRFPNVCRLCLQAKSSAEMISLDSYRPAAGCSLAEMLEEISIKIPFELACYLPVELCESCLEEFEFVFKYKRKVDLIQRFSSALAEVNNGNQEVLVQMFDKEKESLRVLFKELDLCEKEGAEAEELLAEFEEYDIASTIFIKVEGIDADQIDKEAKELRPTDKGEDESKSFNFLDEFQKSLDDRQIDGEHFIEGDFQEEILEMPIANDSECAEIEEDLNSEYTVIQEPEEVATAITPVMEIDDDDESMDEQPPPQKRRYNRLPEEEEEEQQCNLNCNFRTTFPSHFEKHLARLHADSLEILSCHRVECEEELFDTVELLRQHKNDLHNTHICIICGKVTKHLIALENHIRNHQRDREPTLQCTMCDEMFRSELERQRHITKLHMVRFRFECQECGLGFKQKLLLTQHLLSHSSERNYSCDQCEMTFKTSNHLRRHKRTVHTEVRYPCEHCHMTYGRRDKLRMHMERIHDIQTYFVCDICCASFESDGKLQEHKFRHENAQDLECGVCLVAFAAPEDFNDHLCITYQDDYICCKRDFRYHSYYNRHTFLAHGLKTNARVKPKAGVLMGKQRAQRKPVERCPKCEHVFATRKLKKQHVETCKGQVVIFEIEPVVRTPVDSRSNTESPFEDANTNDST